MTIIESRLPEIIELKAGAHHKNSNDMCLMEAVAFVAGEPWSDRPECVCPVLAAFGRSWNDGLPDADRTRLLAPFIPLLIGTRSTTDVQDARAFMASDWAVRVFTPTWLRKAGLTADAEALEALPALTSPELCREAMAVIRKAQDQARAARDAVGAAAGAAVGAAARDAAWDAAWAAARAAARDAAWAAARAAAWAAAWAAARDAAWAAAGAAVGAAARDAAWDAVGAAARAAARDAVGAAVGDALADTVTELQASATELFHRMIAVSA